MPPASLHQSTNTLEASNSSWFSPGRPTKPGSETVPTLMESPVTPCAVSPFSPPSAGPHTPFNVPKSPGPASPFSPVPDGAVELLLPPLSTSSSPRLHAVHSTSVATIAVARYRRVAGVRRDVDPVKTIPDP